MPERTHVLLLFFQLGLGPLILLQLFEGKAEYFLQPKQVLDQSPLPAECQAAHWFVCPCWATHQVGLSILCIFMCEIIKIMRIAPKSTNNSSKRIKKLQMRSWVGK